MANAERRRAELAELVARDDFILEPGCVHAVKEFVELGLSLSAGSLPPAQVVQRDVQTLVDTLRSSYRGNAEMANLLASCLAVASPSEGLSMARDAAESAVRELIMARFDHRAADGVLTSSDSLPAWFQFMLGRREWRRVLYQLAEREQNSHSTLLSFAVKAAGLAGHATEVAEESEGGVAATMDLGVFTTVVKEAVMAAIAPGVTEEDLRRRVLPSLVKCCCCTDHAYLYAQALLAAAAKEGVTVAERLSQELFVAAVTSPLCDRQVVSLIGLQLGLKEVDPRWVGLTRTIFAAFAADRMTPGDVIELHRAFSVAEEGSEKPPLSLLRDFRVIDLLVRELFDPVRAVSDSQRAKCVFLLTEAAKAGDPSGGVSLSAALTACSAVCKRSTPFGRLSAAAESTLRPALRSHAVVGAGVVYWIGRDLTDNHGFLATQATSQALSLYYDLLKDVVSSHPLLTNSVLRLMSKCLDVEPAGEELALPASEFKKHAVSLLIDMVRGEVLVIPVLEEVQAWCSRRSVDMPLVRHFLQQVLESIEPPFSDDFVAAVLRLLDARSVLEAATSVAGKNMGLIKDLSGFLDSCGTATLPPEALKLRTKLLRGLRS